MKTKHPFMAFKREEVSYLHFQFSDFHVLKSMTIPTRNHNGWIKFYFSDAIQLNFQMIDFRAPLDCVSEKKKGVLDGYRTAEVG